MRKRPDDGCLSQLGVARLASGQRQATHEESQHLLQCGHCSAQVAEETALAKAAAQEAVPPAVAALMRRGSFRARSQRNAKFSGWQQGATAAMLMFLVFVGAQHVVRQSLTATTTPTSQTLTFDEHVKGATQVVAAVKDASGSVRMLDDLNGLAALRPKETLQLHVQTFDTAQVRLVDAVDGTEYYIGEVPRGGWLPVGVQVTQDGPLRLTLQVCSHTLGTACQTWELH